jgi:hypothetical protein
MINQLAEEALEFGSIVQESIRAAGGVDLLRRAAAEPSLRNQLAAQVLEPSGVWELHPYSDRLELEAAAAVSRAAGAFAFPYPIVERLATEGDGATALVSRDTLRVINHADLALEWAAVDLTGQSYRVSDRTTSPLGTKLGMFAVPIAATPTDGSLAPKTASLLITLHSWWLLGLLGTATADTIRYTGEREQFGRTIGKFQSVAFTLADASLAVRSLEELAKYTLWSLSQDRDDSIALTDALALRCSSLRAANTVLRAAHQLHGAMGFTNEVNVSWLSRASQSVRRLPEGESQTLDLLTTMIETGGFVGLPGTVRGTHVDSEGAQHLL